MKKSLKESKSVLQLDGLYLLFVFCLRFYLIIFSRTYLFCVLFLAMVLELKARKRTMRRLQFCTVDDVIETKGRVACEISTGDELLLTEMVFNGVFNDLSVDQCVALLSCMVYEYNIHVIVIPFPDVKHIPPLSIQVC